MQLTSMKAAFDVRAWMIVLVLAPFLAGCSRAGPVIFDETSPRGLYRATISGYPEAPAAPFIEHAVTAEVRKISDGAVGSLDLYSGDLFDDGFSQRYRAPTWLSENILCFRSQRAPIGGSLGEIVVENATGDRISLLRIGAEDLFVLVDVAAGARLSVPASIPFSSAGAFVDAEGFANGGRKLQYQGQNFQPDTNAGWRGFYRVVIRDGKISLALN